MKKRDYSHLNDVSLVNECISLFEEMLPGIHFWPNNHSANQNDYRLSRSG